MTKISPFEKVGFSTAHLAFRVGQQDEKIRIREILVLVKSISFDEVELRACAIALEIEAKQPTLSFIGVRRIVRCDNALMHGTELTYYDFELANITPLASYVNQEPIRLQYNEE